MRGRQESKPWLQTWHKTAWASVFLVKYNNNTVLCQKTVILTEVECFLPELAEERCSKGHFDVYIRGGFKSISEMYHHRCLKRGWLLPPWVRQVWRGVYQNTSRNSRKGYLNYCSRLVSAVSLNSHQDLWRSSPGHHTGTGRLWEQGQAGPHARSSP